MLLTGRSVLYQGQTLDFLVRLLEPLGVTCRLVDRAKGNTGQSS